MKYCSERKNAVQKLSYPVEDNNFTLGKFQRLVYPGNASVVFQNEMEIEN